MPSLERHRSGDVTLLTDPSVPGRVTFAFTERAGGVSEPPYASLNLGDRCGDDPVRVAENRRRALAALGAADLLERLVCPHQVHGDRVVTVRSADPAALEAARAEALAGADAVVCVADEVPVLMCFADCVPVVLVAPGGFAVVHSGWRGTLARIAAKAARALAEAAGCGAGELLAYVGPHIGAGDYEVSEELLGIFVGEFGEGVARAPRNLDLALAVTSALEGAGVAADRVAVCDVSTARATDRFFSYRAEGGTCGRHAAVALMGRRPAGWPAAGATEEGWCR
ncbi:laccase domain-containing protein [Olsenella sp. SW781]|uniref:polyphenol oxidase family protein n=1 Tax=Olsenella sp. SW781 TaxID=2530046 RepID=UPI0014397F8B|nr:polyphenol oxidase family protein [Olsenella sp. SW781]NJE80160.1 laccase domain-containing protein [Olsenella sp. SW781]